MITEKILVVDDEEIVCQSIKNILSRKGYEIENALNVEDAVKKINQTSFDLVITDLMMPKTNGMELMQIIRDHYPELEVIMITGYASIETAVKATKLGASSYLPKPFTPDELAEATKNALTRRLKKIERQKIEPNVGDQSSEMIDVDMPFNIGEVTKATSIEYVETLTHSDIPLAKKTAIKAYCNLGKRECRRVITEGRECVGECPLEKKERAKVVKVKRYTSEVIDADLPFSISDVEQATSLEYINCLSRSDIPLSALWSRDATAKHSVLVIDDEPIVCHSVRRILSKQNCSVEEAFDVDAALQKMKLNRYDLILLDLKMQKRSGIEVLQSIKGNWPEIPVIIISGYASIENAIAAIKLGASDIIPKPFTPAELNKKTKEVLVS